MTAKLFIDGLINEKKRWNAIHWNQVFKILNRIQARIVKAVKRGDKKLVRGLQRLLMKSLSAKLSAVRRHEAINRPQIGEIKPPELTE